MTCIIDSISIHAENIHLDRLLRKLKTLKCKIGIAFNPATPLTGLPYVINMIDYVLIMTVNPGLGGQEFIPYTIEKIKEVKSLSNQYNNQLQIQVDGGVGLHNIALLKDSGVDICVVGSNLFSVKDRKTLITKLRSL